MGITERVAARHKVALLIPDTFWKERQSTLKQLLSEKLSPVSAGEAAYVIIRRLEPFFTGTIKKLIDLDLPHQLEESLLWRQKNILEMCTKIVEYAQKFDAECDGATNYSSPSDDPEELLARQIVFEIHSFYAETVPTLAHALKTIWRTSSLQIKTLAKQLVSKAKPAEIEAIIKSENNWDSHTLQIKYDFFDRVNLKGRARKIAAKEKVTYDWGKWLHFLKLTIEVNYTGKEHEEYQQFDLYGMKVIVDDRTVNPEQIRVYVKYLDEAYARLKDKGFAKLWYGAVFIQCESCGGLNSNGKDYGVGGNYTIGTDTVRIFQRPDHGIVELMAHELGHRHWFKGMNQSQRVRFTSLIKLKDHGAVKDMPSGDVSPVTEYGSENIDEAWAEVFAHYVMGKDMTRDQIESFRSVLKTASAESVLIRHLVER